MVSRAPISQFPPHWYHDFEGADITICRAPISRFLGHRYHGFLGADIMSYITVSRHGKMVQRKHGRWLYCRIIAYTKSFRARGEACD